MLPPQAVAVDLSKAKGVRLRVEEEVRDAK